jgi:hypothetical protein
MDGFQAVAGVRQRPVHDGGERVGEVALLQSLAQRDGFHALARRRLDRLAHGTFSLVRNE